MEVKKDIESEIYRKLSRNLCFFGKYLRFDTCINRHISHLWRHFGDKVLAKNFNNLRLRKRVSCGIVSYLNFSVKMHRYLSVFPLTFLASGV